MNKYDNQQYAEIVDAFLKCGTVHGVAREMHMTEQQIKNKMEKAEFKMQLEKATTEIENAVFMELKSHLLLATRTLADIICDDKSEPKTKLEAAEAILSYYKEFKANEAAEQMQSEEIKE